MKKIHLIKIIIFLIASLPSFTFAQTTLIGGATNNGNFEGAAITPWVLSNNPTANTDNRWAIGGSAALGVLGGTKGAYITNNAGATNYSYTTTQSRTQHFYQSVTFPAGESCISLSFNWRCNGEGAGSDWDNIKVFVSSTLPVGGTVNASADQVGATWYNLQNSTQTANITLPASLAGTTKYLIFQFKCDASGGSQTPAAVDNVSLTTSPSPTPACTTYSLPTNGGTACPAGQTLSWSAVAAPSCGSITYDVYFNAGTTATTLASSSQAGITYATGALVNGTVYAWKIVPRNGSAVASGCSTFTFTATTPTPACATYSSPSNGAAICPIGTMLSWSTVTTSCGSITYDVYFNSGTTATSLVSSGQTGTTYATGVLSASTVYAWKIVPKNGSVVATGCSTFTFSTNSVTSASVAPFTNNFETCSDWTLVNGAQTNQWVQGSATNNGGTQSMYITNDGGTTNSYSNGSTSVVHFYKDISFPAGQTCINLNFDWKSVGESGYDDLKVFGISTSVSPIAGTALSAVDQIGSTYNSQSTWQNVSISIPGSYAGTTQRIVFSWRNDGSGGTQPPAAVDNISITTTTVSAPACATYSLPANNSTICPNSVLLSWSTVTATCGSGITYDVYFNAGTSATTLASSSQTATTYNPGLLASSTVYAWKIVPRNGAVLASGCSTFTFATNSFTSATTIPITETFNGSCLDWTLVNGSQTNQWQWGSATGNPSKAMYVSNDGGTSNAYNVNSTSLVHFYKDITFPAALSCNITMSFQWKGIGETGLYDYISVFGANTSFTPVAGTANNAGDKLGTDYYNQSAWQNVSISLPSSYAGTTKRIIFSWKNDGSLGTNPPGAIDNFTITATSPTVAPSCATYSLPVNSATICPSNVLLSWSTVTTTCGSASYNVYFNAGTSATTLVSSAQTGTTYAPGSLSPNTVYAWKIVPISGTLTATGCTTFTFITNSFTPQTIAPLTDSFEGSCLDWTIVNGSQTNIWVQGAATNNGGASAMYITNDAGVSNAYTTTSSSIVHFYKDIAFPAGSSCITLTFDWKNMGESGYDYLRIFGVATTVTPIAGTALTTGQVGIDYVSLSTWQTVNITLPAAFAGTTQRLVFSWRNDGSGGTQPPAAVDNIVISTSSPSIPSCATYIAPTNGANSGCISGTTLQWASVAALCTNTVSYDVYFNTGTSATTLVSSSQSGTTYNTGVLLPSTTYAWKIVPRNVIGPATGCVTYTFVTGNGFVANNLPCNAVNIPLGTIASGDNSCSDNSGEPATPGCWDAGSYNTVWFSFTAPVTGNVKIRTATGTLVKTQIAVYGGTCGTGMTYINCNNNAPNCGIVTLDISELSITGLTSGATYYIAVDGNNSLVGTFAITVCEASATYPALYGKSCSNPVSVCSSTMSVGDPGYQSIGFTCDDDGTANCTGGEKGSVWYQINITAAGSLNFNIVPNDYVPGNNGAETDYDFVLWKIAGATGTVNCATIASSGGNSVTACNYSGDGVTGVAAGGNAPAPYPTYYNGAYEPTVPVANGDVFVLLIENFSNSTSGFNLDFTGSTAGAINFANPTTVNWSGGAANTSWPTTTNWGDCAVPSCSVNAVISPASSFQPLITSAMGTVTVKSMTVDPGAVLTLGANSILKICESLTNNGTIIADPTSTILFSDDVTIHSLNGTLSSTSRLGNLTVVDAVGGTNCTVIANTDIELGGNFTTTNANSIFDLNGKDLTIAGNFINSSGASTFLNTPGSTIIFNGTGAQTYNPNNNAATPTLTLNNVTMSHTGTGVTISTTNTPNMVLGTAGYLTLNTGKIITPNSQEVRIMNTANAAVSTGNATSFVQGNLRRYLAAGATGSFDFPVGHATPGYERANINFTTGAAAGAIELLARFDPWGGTWALPAAPNWTDCSVIYNLSYLDNGYWSIDASSPSTGLYDMTLYNLGYTNAGAASYWTIGKSPSSSPSWTLQGICQTSPLTSLQRLSMSGFSKFSTLLSSAVLPVELIEFKGMSKGKYNELIWKSAAEVNFKHYELESSENGVNFKKISEIKPLNKGASISNYSNSDYEFYKPITYYRLKMIDLDLKYKYSNIISIENHSNAASIINIFPNPASNEINVSITAPTGETTAKIEIQDIYGRLIYSKQIDLLHISENLLINSSNFSDGTYIISVHYIDSPSINKKIVVTKKN